MSKHKNNKPEIVVTEIYTNRFTGARVRMARAGQIDDDTAWIVGDKNLSAYAIDNYCRGKKQGQREGIATGGFIGLVIGAIGAACAILASE